MTRRTRRTCQILIGLAMAAMLHISPLSASAEAANSDVSNSWIGQCTAPEHDDAID